MLAAVLALSLAACGSKDTTEQDAYRQYGINCLESGNYEDAIKAFQNALNQSLGKAQRLSNLAQWLLAIDYELR